MNDRLDPALALPDLAAIRAAHARIRSHVHRTPVFSCEAIDAEIGAKLWFKAENLQKIGAFKARGASNAVFSLSDDAAKRGVVTHSSGNHGAAIAYAASRRGIPAWVVMPEGSAKVKEANVRRLGATIRFCGMDAASRAAVCADVQRETGATMIHPFDNADVIAGQGTAALELLEDRPDLDVVIAPVGGGGLLSGTSIASKGVRPGIRVWGAEPAHAGDATLSFRSGKVEPIPAGLSPTIADGLRTPLAPRTLGAILANVDAVESCSEEAIVRAMRMTRERAKLVIEPSAAVPLACLIERRFPVEGKRVGIIVSGGNVDLDRLPGNERRDPENDEPPSHDAVPRFHLAFPVTDLDEARRFYGGLLGCAEGRSSADWVDFDFHGHQIVAHKVRAKDMSEATSLVDGQNVPVRHFGVVVDPGTWQALAARFRAAGVRFVIEPYVRFEGEPGEQATMFFLDPFGNALEFKAFADMDSLFAT